MVSLSKIIILRKYSFPNTWNCSENIKGLFTPSFRGSVSGSITMGCIEFQLCHLDQAAVAMAAASLANGSMTDSKRCR